jgi:hypothetical protein
VPYFDSLGHCCPTYKNPSDFFMSLAADEGKVEQLAALQLKRWAQQQQSVGDSDVEAAAGDKWGAGDGAVALQVGATAVRLMVGGGGRRRHQRRPG